MSATHATDWIVVDNTSDGRPLVFHSDREALSTARFRRAGSLATADGSPGRVTVAPVCVLIVLEALVAVVQSI